MSFGKVGNEAKSLLVKFFSQKCLKVVDVVALHLFGTHSMYDELI